MVHYFNKFQVSLCLLRLAVFPLKRLYSTDIASFVKSIGPSNINCILTDIDGTVLTSEHELPDKTLNAIKEVINRGYKFFPCTG